MYNPVPFAENRPEELRAFMQQHPLAALVTSGAEELEATHVPMILADDGSPQGVLRCHLARANPQWRTLVDSGPALVIFQGPEHYITPNWYPSKKEHGKVVPTWNYAAVHVRGRAGLFEEPAEMRQHLKELTEQNESLFPAPWSVEDAPAEFIQALSRAIVGVEISIERIEGKWKMSQNRPDADRQGVLEGLENLSSARSREVAEMVKHFLSHDR